MAEGSFVQNFLAALMQAKDYAFLNKRRQWEEEDRGIEKDILAHRLKDLKIQERVRARNAAIANLEALEGQPESSFPRNATDADLTRITPGLPGIVPEEGMVRPQIPTINIPGIEELGVPGIERKPNTLEQVLAAQLAELKQKAMWTPRTVGRGGTMVIPGMAGEDGIDEDGVVAQGEEYPERLYRYEDYNPATGKTTVEMLTQEEIKNRPPATKRPPSSGGGGGANRLTPEEHEQLLKGFLDGSQPIDMIPKTTEGLRMLAGLSKAGFDTTKATADIKAFRTHLNSLNQGQQQQILIASDAALDKLAELEDLVTKAGDPSIWIPGSKPMTDVSMKMREVAEALAILKAGGSAATNTSLEQAQKELERGPLAGMKLLPKITRLKSSLGTRVASIKGSFIGSDDVTRTPPRGAQEFDYDPATENLVPRKP